MEKSKTSPRFRKGQTVWIYQKIIGLPPVYDEYEVLRVSRGKVWLDNGPGNDPTGPFDTFSGGYLGYTMPGVSWKLLSERPKSADG